MARVTGRRVLLPFVVAVATAFGPSTTASAAHPSDGVTDPSGIAVLAEFPRSPKPQTDQQAAALQEAYELAIANATTMGYPWIDATAGSVVIPTTSPTSAETAIAASDGAIAKAAHSIKPATATISRLERLADEVISLRAKAVPNADTINEIHRDKVRGRLVVGVRSLQDDLMKYLAERFGTTDIAVHVNPNDGASTAGRQNDGNPFWGGAAIWAAKGCTSGFAWDINGVPGLLTAAHCAPDGYGNVHTPPNLTVGLIITKRDENWSTSTGTTYYENGYPKTVYRGDVALIRNSPQSSEGKIYTGGTTSSTSRYVAGMADYSPQPDDVVCTGGAATGEHCGFTIWDTNMDVRYILDGWDVWARNVVEADGWWGGPCVDHGDSGGPVYRVLQSGKVDAVGVISGFSNVPLAICHVYFTDIWVTYSGIPGHIKV